MLWWSGQELPYWAWTTGSMPTSNSYTRNCLVVIAKRSNTGMAYLCFSYLGVALCAVL